MQHKQFQTRPRRPKWTGCLPLHWSNSQCLSCPFHLASLESFSTSGDLQGHHFGNLRPKMPPFREVSGNCSSFLGSWYVTSIPTLMPSASYSSRLAADELDAMIWCHDFFLTSGFKKCKPRGKWLIIFMFAISWWSILFGEPNCFILF